MSYTVQTEKPVTIKNEWCRLLRKTEGTITGVSGVGIGIDPGVNFGLVCLDNGDLSIYHGSLKQETEPGRYGYVAYKFLRSMMVGIDIHEPIIIEGAAYGSPYRQPLLAEIRIGFYLFCALSKRPVKILPPKTIRKLVFGHGDTQAGDEWPTLKHDAADALSMAICAAVQEVE